MNCTFLISHQALIYDMLHAALGVSNMSHMTAICYHFAKS